MVHVSKAHCLKPNVVWFKMQCASYTLSTRLYQIVWKGDVDG
jgi:hypothetical protein